VLLTIAVTTAVSQNSTSGNTPPDEQTPAAITDKFNSEHPGVPATWKKDGDNYKVDFVDPDSNMGQITQSTQMSLILQSVFPFHSLQQGKVRKHLACAKHN